MKKSGLLKLNKNRYNVDCRQGKKIKKQYERIKSPDTKKTLFYKIAFGYSKKDISSHRFFNKGSMTIEAALVIPFFLFVCIMILSVMDVMKESMNKEAQIHGLVREGMVCGYLAGEDVEGRDGDYIDISVSYSVSLPLRFFGLSHVMVQNHSYGHIFNGYNDKAGDRVGETEEYVYITGSGEVFHRKRSCSYLNVSVREISAGMLADKRNKDGSIYYACENCVKGAGEKIHGTVYITDYGVRYHAWISCRQLRRSVQVIPLSQVQGKPACKKCAGAVG